RPRPAPAATRPPGARARHAPRPPADRPGQPATLHSLGYAHQLMAQHDRAIGYYTIAIELFRDIDNRYHEAEILTRLGDTHHAAGVPTAARTAWTRSLRLLSELDHPDTEHVRQRLHTNG